MTFWYLTQYNILKINKGTAVSIHLNERNGVQSLFHITKLTPSLLSDSIVDDVQHPGTSHINLAQINRKINEHETCNILLLRKELNSKKGNRFRTLV